MLIVLGAIAATGTGVGTAVVSESVGVTSISSGPSSVKDVGVSDGVGVAVGVGVTVGVVVDVGVGFGVGVNVGVDVGGKVGVGDGGSVSVGAGVCVTDVRLDVIVQAIKMMDDRIPKTADVIPL